MAAIGNVMLNEIYIDLLIIYRIDEEMEICVKISFAMSCKTFLRGM
jgi:hypothetical protein